MSDKLKIKLLNKNAILPTRATPKSAGLDLSSAEDAVVPAKGWALIKTGLAITVPSGTYGRIAPRSGLALKHGINIHGGVIDQDYRGDVGIILFNHSDKDFKVAVHDRIAQLIIEVIRYPEVMQVEELDASERGDKGFGSSGDKKQKCG